MAPTTDNLYTMHTGNSSTTLQQSGTMSITLKEKCNNWPDDANMNIKKL